MTGTEVIALVEKKFKKVLDDAENRGIAEGTVKGISQEKERVAADMLRDGEPIEKIARYSRLAEETIRKLAKSIGVAVM